MSHMTDYDAACERAATEQGLDPLDAALTAANIPHGIAQTGGMTMVLTIPVDTPADPDAAPDAEPGMGGPLTGVWGAVAGDTWEADTDLTPGGWMLVFYPGTTWEDGIETDEDDEAMMQSSRVLTTDAVIDLIRKGGRP